MALVCLAIVGKDNEPLYLRDFPLPNSTRNNLNAPLTGNDNDSNDNVSNALPNDDMKQKYDDPFGFFTESMPKNTGESHSSSLRNQFICHAALDRFYELTGPNSGNRWRTPGATGSEAMWVGLLCPVEELRVYGYLTNTNIKFMAVIEDNDEAGTQLQLREAELKTLFASLHELYVEYTLNPFTKIKAKIVSRRFDESVRKSINAFNGVYTLNWM